ncbi:MAG: glycosyl hydrolase [Planctomycetota bacterium]
MPTLSLVTTRPQAWIGAFVGLLAFVGLCPGASAEISNPHATPEARALFANLQRLIDDGKTAFGSERPTVNGIGWDTQQRAWASWDATVDGDTSRCNIKDVTGEYPGVYGFDIREMLEHPDVYHQAIREAYERGGIIDLVWTMRNPVTGGTVLDDEWVYAPQKIAAGGSHRQVYLDEIDAFAQFLDDCVDRYGRPIPLIVRPFHEHFGSQFWWGAKWSTQQVYIENYRTMVNRLRNTHGHHQLLFNYCPGVWLTESTTKIMTRYPGDDYVDLIGMDVYAAKNDEVRPYDRIAEFTSWSVDLAEARGKIANLGETGVIDGYKWDAASKADTQNFWTGVLMQELTNDPDGYTQAGRIAYAKTWYNEATSYFFLPYSTGIFCSDDFLAFVNDPKILLQDGTADYRLYRPQPDDSPQGLLRFEWNIGDDSQNLSAVRHGGYYANDAQQGNRSFGLDGADDYIDLGEVGLGARFTLMAWVKVHPKTNTHTVLANSTSGYSRNGFRLLVNSYGTNDGALLFQTGNGWQGANLKTASGVIAENTWYHVAVSVNRSTGKGVIYLNGEPVPLVQSNVRANFTTAASVELGRMKADDNYLLKGKVDDLRMFSRVMHGYEIKREAGLPVD